MDWNYITERVQRYNSQPSDDLLYRIASNAEILGSTELYLVDRDQRGQLIPQQRYLILNWLCCNGFEVEGDLALLIFGRQQLTQWLEISRQVYPNFEFYLCFEYQDGKKTGWESGINCTCFWMPKPGAPVPNTDNDFPWKPYWDTAEHFWITHPSGVTNEFDFTLDCYKSQQSFTDSNWILEEGDWQCTPSDEEADLMSVAQVLEHFTVSV